MVTPARAFPDRCVVDASVLIKLVLAEPGSDVARALLSSAALDARATPDLAYLECASILATAVRRGLQTQDEARSGLLAIFEARLTVHPTAPLVRNGLDLALSLGISAYDAAYVALADSLGVPLITADIALVGKMVGTGIAGLDLTQFQQQ